ncbi:hypothetical protein QYF61_018996 [Mycteria americana]|uniref:Uncharacterized protein n=1 Tax=Mycteria americana TaxID=33587 RepID=A0AAN7S8T6_MYCAM|nr:hypothetical protein QYF61_018996 [Mycteria americana]
MPRWSWSHIGLASTYAQEHSGAPVLPEERLYSVTQLQKSFLLSAEASILEGRMTGIIKASGGIPAEHFGVSTKDFANPSLINLFKHLCILSSVQLIPGYLFLFRCLPTVPVFACS